MRKLWAKYLLTVRQWNIYCLEKIFFLLESKYNVEMYLENVLRFTAHENVSIQYIERIFTSATVQFTDDTLAS